MKTKLALIFLFVLCAIGLLTPVTYAQDSSEGVKIEAKTVDVGCCEYGRILDTEIKITFLSGPGSLKSASLDLSTDLHNGVYFELQTENGRFVSGIGITAQDIRINFVSPTLLNIQFNEGSFTAGDSLLLAVNIDDAERGPGDTFTAELYGSPAKSVQLVETTPDRQSYLTAIGDVIFPSTVDVVVVIPGVSTYGREMIDLAKSVSNCGNYKCSVVNICEAPSTHKAECNNDKENTCTPEYSDCRNQTVDRTLGISQSELGKIFDTEINENKAKLIIFNVDMDLAGIIEFFEFNWGASTQWAARVTNSIGDFVAANYSPLDFTSKFPRIIVHSAGAEALKVALQSTSYHLFNDVNILNGRTKASEIAMELHRNGYYNTNTVKVFTAKFDLWGRPQFGKIGSIASYSAARAPALEGAWVHLHNDRHYLGAHNQMRNHPDIQYPFAIGFLKLNASSAPEPTEFDNCYTVIEAMNKSWNDIPDSELQKNSLCQR